MVAQASWQALRASPADLAANLGAFAPWQSFGFGCYISTHPLKVTVVWNLQKLLFYDIAFSIGPWSVDP